jgi:hypothetical protein
MSLNDSNCDLRTAQMLGNFEELILAFSCDLKSKARATILRHVNPSDSFCSARMLHWIDNFEQMISSVSLWPFPAIWDCFIHSFNDTRKSDEFFVVRFKLLLRRELTSLGLIDFARVCILQDESPSLTRFH